MLGPWKTDLFYPKDVIPLGDKYHSWVKQPTRASNSTLMKNTLLLKNEFIDSHIQKY